MIKSITTPEMEVALTALSDSAFSFFRNTVLPRMQGNTIRGIGHECDLLVLTKSGYLHEIEIKISKSDLKADFKKDHHHESELIATLFYAVPDFLAEDALKLIPEEAGLIVVRECTYSLMNGKKYRGFTSRIRRQAKRRKAPKVTPEIHAKINQLMHMRYWSFYERTHGRKIEIPKEHTVDVLKGYEYGGST